MSRVRGRRAGQPAFDDFINHELRLLLPRALWPSAKTQVELVVGSSPPRRLTPQPSAEAFLLDWLEHLDARRAPVAVASFTP